MYKRQDVYRTNAKIMTETLKELGIGHIGGENSPYIWMQCPNGMKSWEFFDDLLAKANVVGTPGSGFGKNEMCIRGSTGASGAQRGRPGCTDSEVG